MKAAVLHAPGPASAFRIEEIPLPTVGPDEVLVKVGACGVSSRDVVERNGTYRRDVTFPLIMGLEISGTVLECGPGVTDLAPGDRVCSKAFSSCGRCRFCRTGRETTCLARRPVRGGYAEYVALASDALVRVPSDMPFEIACGLGPAAGVALNAVRDVARVTVGEDVLVTGATGAVGWAAAQIAKASGARVIATSRSAAKASSLVEAGVDDIVVPPTGGDFSGRVREITRGRGVDAVIDTVGSRVFNPAFDSLGLHGRYAFVGQLFGEEISINPARIFFKRAQLVGVGSVSRAQLEDTIGLVTSGKLRPKIAARLGLDEVGHAHELVESGTLVGRVVIIPHAS